MRPSSEALKSQDAVELEIENEVRKYLNEEQKNVDDTTTNVENHYSKLDNSFQEFKVTLSEFINTKNTLNSALNFLLTKNEPNLKELKKKRMSLETEWRHLRHENNIQREAEYPDNPVAYLFVIAALAVLELIVNFGFFQMGDGQLKAAIIALLIVFANLFGSLAFGIGWRYKNKVNPKWQHILGWLCLPGFLIFTFFSNGVFARYRTEIEISRETGSAVDFSSVISNSYSGILDSSTFQGIESYGIFLMGIIFSFYAFYKGYKILDSYPGYAELDKKLKLAKAQENAFIDQIHANLDAECKRVQGDIKRNHDTPSMFNTQIGNHIALLEKTRDGFNKAITAIKDDGVLLTTNYRSSNRAIRPQDPPGYFSDLISFEFQPNTRDIDYFVNNFEALRAKIEEVRIESERYINEKKEEADKTELNYFGDKIKKIKGGFIEWQEGVEASAKDALNQDRMTTGS
jgi:hypothetical protein